MSQEKVQGLAIILLLFTNVCCETEKTLEIHPLLHSYLNIVLKALGPDILDTAPPSLTPLTSHIKGDLGLIQPSIDKAKYYCYFAFAAYCSVSSLENYNCEYCNATGSDVRIVKVILNSEFNTQVFITKSNKRKEIVVSYRGSLNVPNFVEDFLLVKVEVGHPDIRVHTGNLLSTQSLYPSVLNTVKELTAIHPNYSITLVGHSLGGSEAILTLYFITVMQEFPETNKLSLYTYGQPRVGNKAFVDYINSLNIPAVRVVNQADVIPHSAPAWLGYVHTQNELFVNNGVIKYCNSTIYEDPTCSNSYGPLFSALDHLHYLNLPWSTCVKEDPTSFIFQLIYPLQHFIPHSKLLIYKPILESLHNLLKPFLG